MHVTSIFSGLAVLLGALVAFLFLPSRREFAVAHVAPAVTSPEPTPVTVQP
jgi:hypothetical protein